MLQSERLDDSLFDSSNAGSDRHHRHWRFSLSTLLFTCAKYGRKSEKNVTEPRITNYSLRPKIIE